MGFWSVLGNIGKGLIGLGGGGTDEGKIASRVAEILGGAGAGLGAYSQARASNRGNQFAGQLDLGQLLLQREALKGQADRDYHSQSLSREQDGRAGRRSAWLDLHRAQRTLSPAQRPNVSPYAAPQRMSTAEERAGADALTREVMARLQGGNPLPEVTRREVATPNVDTDLLRAGGAERVTGVLSPILRLLGRGGYGDGEAA